MNDLIERLKTLGDVLIYPEFVEDKVVPNSIRICIAQSEIEPASLESYFQNITYLLIYRPPKKANTQLCCTAMACRLFNLFRRRCDYEIIDHELHFKITLPLQSQYEPEVSESIKELAINVKIK